MGQIDDILYDFKCNVPHLEEAQYTGDICSVCDGLREILQKHLEPQKKAEVCKCPYGNDDCPKCSEPQQEDKKHMTDKQMREFEEKHPNYNGISQQEDKKIERITTVDCDTNIEVIHTIILKIDEIIQRLNERD